MPIFGRKAKAESPSPVSTDRLTPEAIPSSASLVLDRGVGTIAQQVADRLAIENATRQPLADELRRCAVSGWERQRAATSTSGAAHGDRPLDAEALFQATKSLFDGTNFPGLADLALLQRDAVFRVFPMLGLATLAAGNQGSYSLVVEHAAGGMSIVDSLGALHKVLFELVDDENGRAAFTAATDAVLWGAALAIAHQQLQAPGPPVAATPVSAVIRTAREPAAVKHVLSFSDFDGMFAAQAEILERIPGVGSVTVTYADKDDVSALVEAHGLAADGSTLGHYVLIAPGPASVAVALAAIANAHGGSFHFYADA